MSMDVVIAFEPIAIGDFIIAAIAKRMTAAIRTLVAKKMKGSAYGRPYLAPTKPVLHRRTKRSGAIFESFNPRRSPSGVLMILPST